MEMEATPSITPEVLLLLVEAAGQGPDLRALLRTLGGIARVAALVVSLNGGDNAHLFTRPNLLVRGQGILSLSLRLLGMLVAEALPEDLQRPSHLRVLSSRRFVELAATLHPDLTSVILAKLTTVPSLPSSFPSSLSPRPSSDCQRVRVAIADVVGVLVDRTIEAAALQPQASSLPPPSRSSVSLLSYPQSLVVPGARPLLRVLEAVLGPRQGRGREGGRENAEVEQWRLELSMPLIHQCSAVLRRVAEGRRGGGRGIGRGAGGGASHELSEGEMDLIWQVTRLYFALAARSPVATAFMAAKVGATMTEWRKIIKGMTPRATKRR